MAGSSQRPTRLTRVDGGVALLEQALEDLVHHGLARAGDGALERLARRLVDAQAAGLAAAVQAVAAEADAERRVLGLGSLQLLCDAWTRLEALPLGLQADVRAAVGIAMTETAVRAHGDVTHDTWLVLGQVVEVDAARHLRTTRTWLRGLTSGRTALHLAFAAGLAARRRGSVPAAAGHVLTVGTRFFGALAFWPSAAPLRALIAERDAPEPFTLQRLPGRTGIAEWLEEYARLLAAQPFLARALVVLGDVRAGAAGENPFAGQVVDGAHALPFSSRAAWTFHAVSGGRAVDVVAEWDGERLRPLAVLDAGAFVALEPLHE